MGIGTSLGAYFETTLDHHAGNESPQLDSQHKGVGNWFKDKWDENEYSGEGVAHDDTPIPISDIRTASPLVTITDADIDKGVSLGMSFSGGGLSTKNVTPFRRAANDNKKLQIDDPVMDANIEDSWNRMVRGQQIVADRQTLINTQSERTLNDIEKARLSKLDKEHAKHFGNYYPD